MQHGQTPRCWTPEQLDAALAHCQEQTRAHSKTFYFGSRFFPPAQRKAVWAVYAACRRGDDIADEPGGGEAALTQWWQATQAALRGQGSLHPVDTALSWAASQFPLPEEAFHELYLGLQMDLHLDAGGEPCRDFEELELYCRRVAGVIGFMIAPISGYSGGERTLNYALKLGQAMQLTNILRDVGEDLARGRIYLPQTLLARHGVTRAALEAGRVTPPYRALMAELSGQARAWYREGRAGLPYLHGSGRLAVTAAARAYEGILDALEANDYDNFRRRAQVSGTRKLLMLPGAWWEVRSRPNLA
ncbi:phytoene/squalene synthase family protein [Deinococcus irradiatisoli]|uniref:Phytoene/squalene synthase family protein n=1 Tax=Deinococcus irradiatisoli TaxID=2202254 RepID=A0A2Z3JCN5_9DEIO|nr:phytoene/squalene synthase family protein [Deinococcus irradiatisoli]AWN22923.1 phytoene/squalene synthase family protein [Deinococcus irradiatisoli]